MLKFHCIGSGEYLKKGVAYLAAHGFEQAFDPELLVCLAHPEILKRNTLDKYRLGAINFHCGLPKYRGRHPLQWMLIEGVPEIPVAVHQIDEGIDTGPIIVEKTIPVERDETYETMLDKVTDSVGPLLVEAFDRIERGDSVLVQNKADFGYYPKRTPEQSKIDWNQSSEKVHNFINALSYPMPNAFDERGVYGRSYSGKKAGEILAQCEDGRVVVSTANGVVLVDWL